MPVTPETAFANHKALILTNFDFDRVIETVRATGFGWAKYSAGKPDKWFWDKARDFATSAMDSAFNLAQEINGEAWSRIGGFCATARPNGRVMLEFVVASWGYFWDEDEENRADEYASVARIGDPFVTAPRRLIKLHENT